MLTRAGKRILDHNLTSLIREDTIMPTVLEELVLDIHEYPDLVAEQILNHRFFRELVYGLLRIMAHHTPERPRLAGNAAYIIGSLIDNEVGKNKILPLLKDPARDEDTQHFLPNLAGLIEVYDIEAMTNASGTASLLFQTEGYTEWALGQPAIDWFIFVLARTLTEGDMWVASNCVLTLARMCMSEKGRQKIWEHKDNENIIVKLIMSLGIDSEGRGMNAAYALAYLCEDELGMKQIAYMKEVLDLNLGLIHMLKSVNDDCRKNAIFCFKQMSKWHDGQDRINDDPDVDELLKLLCSLLTGADEDLGKMAAITLRQLAERMEGYLLQKDHSPCKETEQHVLSQMSISEEYRRECFEALKALMIPKPDPPELKVLNAFSIEATWQPVEAKSEAEVYYELYNGDEIVYTGPETKYTVNDLKEKTDYEFHIRAFTDEDEESFPSDVSHVQTSRAISSPPQNIRAVTVTSSQLKIVWEKPEKIMGTLKGYYVQETGGSIHYEPVYMYHIASNLESDREYTFQVCAVTHRGRGEMAVLTVRTLRQDYNSPSRPTLLVLSSHEIVVTWKPPNKPAGRINGYEVLCNGKAIYFGQNKRCVASSLLPNTKYKFTVVAWTSEGRTESEPAVKKTSSSYKKIEKNPKWKNKDELFKWLDAQEVADIEDVADSAGCASENEEDESPTPIQSELSPKDANPIGSSSQIKTKKKKERHEISEEIAKKRKERIHEEKKKEAKLKAAMKNKPKENESKQGDNNKAEMKVDKENTIAEYYGDHSGEQKEMKQKSKDDGERITAESNIAKEDDKDIDGVDEDQNEEVNMSDLYIQ